MRRNFYDENESDESTAFEQVKPIQSPISTIPSNSSELEEYVSQTDEDGFEDDVNEKFQRRGTSRFSTMLESNDAVKKSYKLYQLPNKTKQKVFFVAIGVMIIILGLTIAYLVSTH